MEIISSFGIGIIGGIIASILYFFITVVVLKIIIPWLETITYKGVVVKGTWTTNAYYEGKVMENMGLEITQNATRIKAKLVCVEVIEGNVKSVAIFVLAGFVKDRFVHLYGENKDRKKIGVMSILCEIKRGGNVLEGVDCWYDTSDDKICSAERKWAKK